MHGKKTKKKENFLTENRAFFPGFRLIFTVFLFHEFSGEEEKENVLKIEFKSRVSGFCFYVLYITHNMNNIKK